MATIKIMSFNLKTCSASVFSSRIARIAAVIRSETPDLIGFQEVMPGMQAILRDALPEYTVLGCGRGADYTDEAMTVALKNGVFELFSLQQFWLSPTPTRPGTIFPGDQSACPRMALSAEVILLSEKKRIRFCNTHLDHQGEQARYLGMMQILQHLSAFDQPLILTGDMNAAPEDPEIKLATSALKARGFANCTNSIGGTFHNWGKRNNPIQIDYIFSDLKPVQAYVVQEPDDAGYYSDHYAVCATLKI